MFYEVWTKGLDAFSDTTLVNSVLHDELAERNINLPFFVGISAPDTALLVSGGADSLKLIDSEYVVPLFPNSIIGRSETLSIYFPNRKSYVFKAVLLPASLSLLFSLFIVIVFALSIYYIVSQKKLSEMKSDFINNMTHEFKTPLATISVATDAIVNDKVISHPDQVKHFASVIKNENQRMNRQVETILQMARLDRKDFDFKFAQVDIHQVLEKAIESLLLQIESRGGSITFSKGAFNTALTADAQHLQNLFRNLIDNANKYSPEAPKISLTTRNDSGGVWVTVADKGIGMSKQVQQRVFERFFRESSGNIHNVKGFGLGLSYVKAIVDAHKGQIIVQSEPGKGSAFEVFIPFNF
jgi:two-component system phosphate regulon sensor histidine kinase PhoR